MNDRDLLEHVRIFDFPPFSVEYRGKDQWAVVDKKFVYSLKGEWESEPLLSIRDDDFIGRTRFLLQDAIRIAMQSQKQEVGD